MRCSLHQVSLEEVIRLYPMVEKLVAELHLSFQIIVDTSEKHTLVHHWNAQFHKAFHGLQCLLCDFERVVELGHEVEGSSIIVLLEYSKELWGETIWIGYQCSGTETIDDVWSGALEG